MIKKIDYNKDSVIDDTEICIYMEILEEITNFWHGQTNNPKYYDEIEKIYSTFCYFPLDSDHFWKSYGECNWKTDECKKYASLINIDHWKKIEWNSFSPLITKFDKIDILVSLFKEQILVFYRMGLLKNDIDFRITILKFLKYFDIICKRFDEKNGVDYIYNAFSTLASYMYQNNYIEAKNEFTKFTLDLEEKCGQLKKESQKTLVMMRVEEFYERR